LCVHQQLEASILQKKKEKKEDATRTPARWFKRICAIAKRPLVEAKTSSFLPTSLSREQLKLQ